MLTSAPHTSQLATRPRPLAAAWFWVGLLLLTLPFGAPAQQLAHRHFSADEGLSHNKVYDLLQDRQGRLWAATRGGACWYDGTTFHPLSAIGSPPDHCTTALGEQADGTLWLGYQSGGLAWVRGGRLHRYKPAGFAEETVRGIYFSDAQTLWVASSSAIYRCRLGTAGHPADTVGLRINPSLGLLEKGLPEKVISSLAPGPPGRLLVAGKGGLLLLDTATGSLAATAELPADARQGSFQDVVRAADTLWWAASATRGLLRLSRPAAGGPWHARWYGFGSERHDNNVLKILPDRRGRLWMMTVNGAKRLDPDGTVQAYPEPANQSAFPGELLEDREGNIWLGHGATGLHQRLADEQFTFFGEADGLPAGGVMSVLALGKGVYWVGTHVGVMRFEPTAAREKRVQPVPLPPGLGQFVRSLHQDRRGGIWVGTSGSAARYDPGTGQWANFAQQPGIDGQRVLSIAEDRQGRVWLATQDKGLTFFDPATGRWRTFSATDPDGPGTEDFWKMQRGHDGSLWFATYNRGLLRLDEGQPGAPDHFTAIAKDKSLSDICEDPQGGIWMITQYAQLLHYDGRRVREIPARRYPGPRPNLELATVQTDRAGRVWIGTGQGVDCYDPRTGLFRSFGPAEGFLGEGAQETATYLAPDGDLWVGTHQGLMRHHAAGAFANRQPPLTRLAGLRLFLRDTAAAPGLSLPHDQNQLTFDYVGVSLTNPAAVRYRYQLRGFDQGWQGPVASASATYTNLPPGDYTFAVKAANNEGVWNAEPATYSFQIRPPWWRTWWACLGYAGLFGLLLYGVRHNARVRERQRADQELERQALNQLRELDRLKTDFFTNVSHEFRTPLTLILGPAEELAADADSPSTRQRGGLVLRNARKLLQLINQLLDLSKLEAGALKLLPTPGDVAMLARRLVASFDSLAVSREITLRCEAPAGPVPLVFDAVKLEDILTNLLANALRFTPAGGEVTLTVAETPPTPTAPTSGVVLTVRDTGPGIAAKDIPRLFERFYQAENPPPGSMRTGTGIGLVLVRELTALHGGTVTVASELGAGATFTVHLPRVLQPSEVGADSPAPTSNANSNAALAFLPIPKPETEAPGTNTAPDPEAELVLIVEDNDEVRELIRSSLAPAGYRFLEAPDGLAGVALAQAEVPDLVVSDVMMPGLDGYQVCEKLKTDPATSHIPIVLLTAKAGPDVRLEGLETGADSFLAKPFNPRELRAQVKNLLALRQRIRDRFAAVAAPITEHPIPNPEYQTPGVENPPAGAPAGIIDPLAAHAAAVAELPSLDQKFLLRLNEAVLSHLDDEDFDVDQLVEALLMSRAQVYRKLKALTGQAPREYIRITRLNRALALLRAQVGSVAEVAYQVGFSSATHFSTAFSRQFGYPPSSVAPPDGQ